MTVSLFTPYCTATIDGTAIDTQLLRGARVESSFSDPVSKGYVKCLENPGFTQGDEITITLGSGLNNLRRFRGTVIQGDWLNSGPTFELVCRGPLYAAQKYRNNRPNGILLQDLTGGAATDEAIATAALAVIGLSGNIGGTGIVRGGSAAVAYTWRKGTTLLDYLQELTKASLGYKMVESTDDGTIHRVQVLSLPDDMAESAAEFTLTEGVDIFEGAHTQKSSADAFEAWEVTGFDYGDGLGPVSFTYPTTIPAGTIPFAFSSQMIERNTDADTRPGISCETVTGYLRGENGHTITRLSGIQTPRDDLFGPGQIHRIRSTMLGVDQNFVCVGVTAEVDDQWFIQTLEYTG
jgi:hypothetical protein